MEGLSPLQRIWCSKTNDFIYAAVSLGGSHPREERGASHFCNRSGEYFLQVAEPYRDILQNKITVEHPGSTAIPPLRNSDECFAVDCA